MTVLSCDYSSVAETAFPVASMVYSFSFVFIVAERAVMNFDLFEGFSSFRALLFPSFGSASLLEDLGG